MVDSFHFWERERDDDTVSGGTIVLSQRFWDEVVDQCFPIDLRKAQYFRAYPTAYDLYLWLTYRLGDMERKGTKTRCGSTTISCTSSLDRTTPATRRAT